MQAQQLRIDLHRDADPLKRVQQLPEARGLLSACDEDIATHHADVNPGQGRGREEEAQCGGQ